MLGIGPVELATLTFAPISYFRDIGSVDFIVWHVRQTMEFFVDAIWLVRISFVHLTLSAARGIHCEISQKSARGNQ